MSADTDPQDNSLDVTLPPKTPEVIGANLIGRFLGSPDGLTEDAEAEMRNTKNLTLLEYFNFHRNAKYDGADWYVMGTALAFLFHTEMARLAGKPHAPLVELSTFQNLRDDLNYEISLDEADFETGDFSREEILHMRILARTDSTVNGILEALLRHPQHRSLTPQQQKKFTAGAINVDRLIRAQATSDRNLERGPNIY